MKTIFIILTSKCNRSCEFCFYNQDKDRRKKDTLKYHSIIKTLDFLRENHFDEVTFTGGEPLLNKDVLIKLIIHSKKLGYYINLDTNAVLLDKNLLRKLEKSGVNDIYISSENLDFRKLNLFKDSTIKPIIITVITKNNLKKIPARIKKLKKYNYEIILQPSYINLDSKNAKKLSLKNLLPKERKNLINTIKKWDEKNVHKKYQNVFLSFYGLTTSKTCPHVCHMGMENIVIDSDGSVFPCFHRQDLYCGNINTQKLGKIFKEITKTRRRLGSASCYREQCISLFYH